MNKFWHDIAIGFRFTFQFLTQPLAGGTFIRDKQRQLLDTLGLHVSRLQAGETLTSPRTTASSVYAVIDGRGRSHIDGSRFDWQRGDVFVVPAWRPHECQALERSHLFRVTDEPLLARLHWLRTEGNTA